MREELGIREENHGDIEEAFFMDLFLEKTNFEISITSYIKMDMDFEKLKQLYMIAQDVELDTNELRPINFTEKDLNDFVGENQLTSTAIYNLNMLLARKSM